MIELCIILTLASFGLAWPATVVARTIGRRLNTLDAGGVAGQIKAAPRRVPNIGGIGIFWPMALLTLAGLIGVRVIPPSQLGSFGQQLEPFIPGVVRETRSALVLLGGLLVMHLLGLIDDRRPLGPWLKLSIMLGVTTAAVWLTDTRMFTLLDQYTGGSWASIAVSVLWVCVITNAFNFLDNMDGLSGGVGAISAFFFLAAAVLQPTPQWFVAAMLAILIGALAGFLMLNFPWRGQPKRNDVPSNGERRGASIFMGDGGSLVVGFLLGVISMRITYLPASSDTANWYAVLMPLAILAIPLYDFTSVVVLRLLQGKSPLVGDMQHFSHRLVRHGLSTRSAVLVIYGCTGITGISGLLVASTRGPTAALAFVQVLLVLAVVALYEWRLGNTSGATR